MQVEWPIVVVRFALYLDLMLVFGLPLFGWYALHGAERTSSLARQYLRWTMVAGVTGVLLSMLGMVAMAKAMSGASSYADLDAGILEAMVTGTGFGAAWSARQAALLVGVLIALTPPGRSMLRFPLLALVGALALSTLAWAGHGAMDDDGVRHASHLLVDIAHLLAAGAWVGALAAFVLLGNAARRETAQLRVLARTAERFATPGTMMVATLVVTGGANYWFIAGMPSISAMATPYGKLLLVKLTLFALMLGMAATNRYRLTPKLVAAVQTGNTQDASRALRRSLLCEMATATAVLMTVAVLGVASPDAQANAPAASSR
ncbi:MULTISPECIES: copper homeostasis membrane protein CopD [unclassified Cupriavidus]|uniref:copper homeostasis membrane protein CopD n=1 Tax=Cupriavidus sp. H19C3 TaxID=3241603 RepID=UPI003BF7D2AB